MNGVEKLGKLSELGQIPVIKLSEEFFFFARECTGIEKRAQVFLIIEALMPQQDFGGQVVPDLIGDDF